MPISDTPCSLFSPFEKTIEQVMISLALSRRPKERCVRGQPGVHRDEFLIAKRAYDLHRLTVDQFNLLQILCGGIGPKHLLPHAEAAIMLHNNKLQKLSRIQMRQKYALWAWYSANWSIIFSPDADWEGFIAKVRTPAQKIDERVNAKDNPNDTEKEITIDLSCMEDFPQEDDPADIFSTGKLDLFDDIAE